ncbi:site-specific DNA-methyltransferase [Parafannyhessea umbonata]|uniref:site-specific DNA-methyltransferase n=1 Tax=Parafannyhessea umbonata TaxID=604330 RepID=UPI003F9D5FB4
MPTLDWMGKDKVVDYYHQVPYRILERIPDKSVLDRYGSDCGNMIIHGDNLEALKALLPEYEDQVDCIYIDPPYNTGNEGWVYNDNVNDPRIRKWLGQAVGKEGEDLTRHDKWLCMMYPRLQLLRKMLKPTGSIFISIGDDECASLKYVCDEIFGLSCFQGDISWQRSYAPRNDKHGMPVEVEHILAYSMKSTWEPGRLERTEEMDAKYSNPDNDFAPWKSSDGFAPNAATHQGMVYAIQHPFTGELIYPYAAACWRYDQPTMLGIMSGWCDYKLEDIHDEAKRAEVCGVTTNDVRPGVKAIVLAHSLEESRKQAKQVLNQGPWPRFYFTKNGQGGICRKTYLTNVEGKLPTNLWMYDDVGHTDEGAKELKEIFCGRAVFQNPKPSRLVRRILQIACPDDGLVLDAFAGSGTTAQAVLQENAVNHSGRRFILIEMGDYADGITAERVRKTINGYRTTKKHVERLYEKKLTASNLKRCRDFYDAAQTVADNVAEGTYDKVEGPRMDGSAIVVNGITYKGEDTPPIDSGFSFYELGPALFVDEAPSDASYRLITGNHNGADNELNPTVPRLEVMRYVWYTETKAHFEDRTDEHPYLMGEINGVAYYLAWEPDGETTLDYELLAQLPVRGETTVIYADRCVLDDGALNAMNVRYKQIPRQIARM